LVYSTQLERQIAARFRSFGREMAENNKRQAYIPEGALPLRNPVGTAPCFLSEDVNGRGFVISLPGVPRELEYMLDNVVLPLLVERMGGTRVMKVRVLRTCAVGESNVDRVIGDLMSGDNPTVGLAAHPGQTDIRITAKADTEAEAEALIAPVESLIRERLGVAIYGVDKETVPEVVGRLLAERGLKLGLLDTLTGGQMAHTLSQAGYGDLVINNLHPRSVDEALHLTGADSTIRFPDEVVRLAEFVAPANGLGLALIGPFEDNLTAIALSGPKGLRLTEPGRNYKNTDYIRRWLVTQALDKIRRQLLGQLTSPAD
jgi:hypothetical protein